MTPNSGEAVEFMGEKARVIEKFVDAGAGRENRYDTPRRVGLMTSLETSKCCASGEIATARPKAWAAESSGARSFVPDHRSG